MSRPPRPHSGQSTTGAPLAERGAIDYLPSEFADFVERQRSLAEGELGLVSSAQEGDFAVTLMELSALVAHVLGFYQDRYAREAFLGTAEAPQSLVRHGRRLAYEPDPGLAATGHLALTIGAGLAGTIPAGFAVASAPVGEQKAQDYETLDDIGVTWLHNELEVKGRLEPYDLDPPNVFEAASGRLGVEPGELVVVERADGNLSAHTVLSVEETPGGATTRLTVTPNLPVDTIGPGFRLHAKPASSAHLFGWDSPPLAFSDADLRLGAYVEDKGEGAGYLVDGHSLNDLYLSRELDKNLVGGPVARVEGEKMEAFTIEAQASKAVTFQKKTKVTTYVVTLDAQGKPQVVAQEVPVTRQIAATVTALRAGKGGAQLDRSEQQIRASRWLLGFRLVVPLVYARPSTQAVDGAVRLNGVVDGLEPGQLLALSRQGQAAGDDVEIAEIASIAVDKGDSLVSFRVVDPAGGGQTWTLGSIRIRGNVVRISHGKAAEEILGDSDGTTPFLRFALKNKPLTHLPSGGGAAPALEIRVGGVLWARVPDLYESGPYDRHYLLQRDEAGTTFVVFGDGRHGAIPPAGKRHVTARYRVGLGRAGNAAPGRVDRIKKAHPLVERALNPRRVGGGADPAGAEDVRTQATRYIRTFDRAVSVQDHADLALLFPGVARAAAHWGPVAAGQGGPAGRAGVRVVVADAPGEQPAAMAEIKKFLDARRDGSVPLEVLGPSIRHVQLRMYLEIDRAFLADAVQSAVRDALYGERPGAPGLFTFAARGLGEPAFLSEIYAAVGAVPGVSFAQITAFDLAPGEPGAVAPPRLLDVVPAGPGAWVRLRPEDFDFSLPAEVSP